MIVPKPSREEVEAPEPTPEPTPSGTTLLVPVNASELGRRRRRFDQSSAFFIASGSPGRSTPATTEARLGLIGRQSCASGLTYYACANGFTGCCQGNPCTQTAQCSVEGPTSSSDSNTSTSQSRTSTAQSSRQTTANNSGTRTATSSGTRTATSTNSAGITTADGTPSGTGTESATTLSTPNATPAPSCPGAPSNYTDSLGIAYEVQCNIDSGAPFNQTITVGAGGYAQCCSACSTSRDCAGFTFYGNNGNSTDAGTCYVRSFQPENENFNSGSYVVALSKVDPSAVATTPVPSSSDSAASNNSGSGTNVGAIAGGVIGGVAALGLLLALLAFFIRRHRKRVDARHAAEKATTLPTSNTVPPSERYHDHIGGHNRTGSTANDIYAPQGGFTSTTNTTAPPHSGDYESPTMMMVNKSADHFSELEGHSSTPPGMRAEGGRSMIPAAVLRPPQMLDSRSVGGNGQAAGSRTSVFLEHMSEMEDTSTPRKTTSMTSPYSSKAGESPTLGQPSGSSTSLADETRRRQHLLYWNNYDSGQLDDRAEGGQLSATMMPKTPPSARTAPATAGISPDNGGGGAHDSSFVVSPLNVRKSERGSSPSRSNLGPERRGTS